MQAGWRRGAGGVAVGWLIAGVALADVPDRINYQGRLVTSSNLVNGTVSLVLRLYDAETGGTLRYADSNRVTVVDGLYATWLGDNTIAGTLTNALAQPQVWVELVVNGSRLSPRERLGSVPYALNANALSTANPVFSGVVTAAGFAGDGSGLTALESARLTGPLTITPTPVRVGYIDDGGYFDDVAVAGNYAYVADSLVGLWIYNVSDPAHPVNVAHTNNGGSAQGVAVAGNYAYLANDGDGLRIYDVSDPANPINVAHTNNGAYARGVAVAGNYAYLANLHDGLRIYDVSDPAAPVAVGHIDDGGNALGVAVAGNCAYLANHGDGLRIYDVSDPAHPVSVGHANNGGIAKRVAVVDNYAYLANSSDGLRIYDVSDPAHPLNIAHTNNVGNAQGVAVAGNYAYLANWDDGVRIYDVSDPGFPVAVGHIDDGNNGFASGVAVKDGYAYLANHNGGLRIYASEFVANVAGTVSARGLVGNGGGLTNLSGTAIASGTVPDARLPANLARRDVGQTFTGSNTFNNALNRFTGNGAGLTALNAGNLTSGTLPDARLPTNLAKLNAAQTFSAQQTLGAGAALNDTDMLLRAGTDASHGIGWYGTGKTFEGIVMEGPVIYGYWGGALGSKNGGDSIALRWDERRRVGIGTATPQRTLHVKDVMRLEPRATAPTNPAEGDMYMDSATHKLKVYDGTTWQNCW